MRRIRWRIRVRFLLVLFGLAGIAFGVERSIQRWALYLSKASYHAEFVDSAKNVEEYHEPVYKSYVQCLRYPNSSPDFRFEQEALSICRILKSLSRGNAQEIRTRSGASLGIGPARPAAAVSGRRVVYPKVLGPAAETVSLAPHRPSRGSLGGRRLHQVSPETPGEV